MKSTLRKQLSLDKNYEELRDTVIQFKNDGGSQVMALQILEDLRVEFSKNERIEDKILDLMDVTSGWTQERHKIWTEES